jgi:hypothetical protein
MILKTRDLIKSTTKIITNIRKRRRARESRAYQSLVELERHLTSSIMLVPAWSMTYQCISWCMLQIIIFFGKGNNNENRANYKAYKYSIIWPLYGLANSLKTIRKSIMVRLSMYRSSEGDSKKKRFYPWWSLCQACWQRLKLSRAGSQQADLNISM